jgi:hypothetical protein
VRVAALAASLAAALALLATGCGGSEEPEGSAAVDWADGVCLATTQWTEQLKEIGSRFTDLSNLSQDRLEEAANDAREATLEFVSAVRELGAPDTEAGVEAKRALDELTTELEAGIAEIQETLEGIQGIAGIPRAIASIGGTLTSLSQEVSSTLETLRDGELGEDLRRAFEEAPACDELTSSASS